MYRFHKLDMPPAHQSFITLLLLMLGGDIEPHPGPIEWPEKAQWAGLYPCGVCDMKVDWSDIAICCDDCDVWYHKSCASMPTQEYDNIENKSWHCYHCNSDCNSSFLYHGYNLNVSNSFEPLAGIPPDDSVFMKSISSPGSSDFVPNKHSSPIWPVRSSQHSSSSAINSATLSTGSETNHTIKSTDNFRTVASNVNSIKGKKAELGIFLETVQPDIMLVCETKLDKSVKNSEFLPPQYTCQIRKDVSLNARGVMIIHKREIVIDEIELDALESDSHDDIVWGRITVQDASPVYVGSYYRSSSSYSGDTITSLQSSLDHISSLVKNNPRATIILGADFNAGDINWQSNSVPETSSQKTLCTNIIDTLDNNNLSQLVRNPTREENILDLYCTNKPNLISDIRNVPGLSDHDFIVVDSTFKAVTSKKQPRRIYKWAKANWEEMKKDTMDFVNNLLTAESEATVQVMYSKFLEHIKGMVKNHVPSSWSRTSNRLPWITPKLRRQCKKKQRLYNKARKTKKPEHWAKYKAFAKESQKQIKQAHWQHLNRILETAQEDNNPKPF